MLKELLGVLLVLLGTGAIVTAAFLTDVRLGIALAGLIATAVGVSLASTRADGE